VGDWRALSLVLGMAAPLGVDAFLCLGSNYTAWPCASLSSHTNRVVYRSSLLLRNWLVQHYQNSSATSAPTRFDAGRQYGALDVSSWLRGVSDAWARVGLPAADTNTKWLLGDPEYLRKLDLATVGTLEEWKSYLAAWIVQVVEVPNPKIQDLLEPFALEEEHAEELRYLEHMTHLIHGRFKPLSKPNRDLLQRINQALLQRKPESCADLFAVIRVARIWQNVTTRPKPSHHYPHTTTEKPVSPPDEILRAGVLFREPSPEEPMNMIDNFGRLGWRLGLLMSQGNATEATLNSYTALCDQSPDHCSPIRADDLPWIRRFLWNIAASNCGHEENSRLLDESMRGPLTRQYHSIFDCNGI
jgi:hypothetical protein